MTIRKAGCILLNRLTGKVCLVWRDKHLDCSFPKGHVEANETFCEAALRETDEETGRCAVLITTEEPVTLSYTNIKGKAVEVCYFFAYDAGPSQNRYSADLVHTPVWVTPDKVIETVTHENLRAFWKEIQTRVETLLKW